jgi:hypothetical protein
VNAVPLRQLRHRRYLAQCLQGYSGVSGMSFHVRPAATIGC